MYGAVFKLTARHSNAKTRLVSPTVWLSGNYCLSFKAQILAETFEIKVHQFRDMPVQLTAVLIELKSFLDLL